MPSPARPAALTAVVAAVAALTVTNLGVPGSVVPGASAATLTTEPSRTVSAASTPGAFVTLRPARVVDTRRNVGGPPAPANGATTVQITGRGGIPANVGAVLLNVAAIGGASGYATVYPAGRARPTASNLNFARGVPVSNEVTVTPGSGGKITLFAHSHATTQFLVDVEGYYRPGTVTAAGAFSAITPTRILDTRTGFGGTTPGPKGVVDLHVGGRAGVPRDASAVVMNLTATAPRASGYLSAYPTGRRVPGTSSLNFRAGRTVPNQVTTALGTDGVVAIRNGSAGRTVVVADVLGYYRGGTPTFAGTYVPVSPTRVADTARKLGFPSGFYPGSDKTLEAMTALQILPENAGIVSMNVTLADETATSYLTVDHEGARPPHTSTVNYQRGVTIAHGVTTSLNPQFYNRAGRLRGIVDVTGYYLSAAGAGPGTGGFTGRVVDAATGAPAVHPTYAEVLPPPPYGGDALAVRFARTDSDGRFTLIGLPPGRYVVCAGPDDLRLRLQDECFNGVGFNGETPPDNSTVLRVTADHEVVVPFTLLRR